VPDESTIRKLCHRLGAEVVDEITRAVIEVAQRERRFVARAVRCDSTVVEADIRYPSDAGLAVDSVRLLAAESKRVARLVGDGAQLVRGRSRAASRRLRLIGRTVARRRGEAKASVLRLTGEAGELVRASVREARRLVAQTKAKARGRGARTKLAAARRIEALADRAEKVAEQIRKRLAARRSAIGWCRSPIPTRARSARASWASRPSLAMSSSSPRSPSTPAAARADCSCPPARRSGRATSPNCCPPPSPRSTDSTGDHASSNPQSPPMQPALAHMGSALISLCQRNLAL
jgi:hypothetical protein